MSPDRPDPSADRRRRQAPRPPGGHERRLDARPADAAVTLELRAHGDGREIVVRRAQERTTDGPPRVHIDAVVR
jgi:hypothetical protein